MSVLYNSKLTRLALEGIKITVERTKFEDAPYWINVMLVIDNPSFWNLRGQDQIKFSKDLNVFAIQKKSMPFTHPSEFRSDVDISEKIDEK